MCGNVLRYPQTPQPDPQKLVCKVVEQLGYGQLSKADSFLEVTVSTFSCLLTKLLWISVLSIW